MTIPTIVEKDELKLKQLEVACLKQIADQLELLNKNLSSIPNHLSALGRSLGQIAAKAPSR